MSTEWVPVLNLKGRRTAAPSEILSVFTRWVAWANEPILALAHCRVPCAADRCGILPVGLRPTVDYVDYLVCPVSRLLN